MRPNRPRAPRANVDGSGVETGVTETSVIKPSPLALKKFIANCKVVEVESAVKL